MIEVRVRYTRAAQADPSLMAKLQQPMILAEALARRVYDRVVNRGDLATAVKQYKAERRSAKAVKTARKRFNRAEQAFLAARERGDKNGMQRATERMRKADDAAQQAGDKLVPFRISDEYAKILGITETRFDSSAHFHNTLGVKPGSFRVSGGMWSGLQVRNVGGSAAVIDFSGSTTGGQRQRTTTAGGRARSRAPKVRNQIKAGTVLRNSGVNVIQPKEQEIEAMVAGVTRWSQELIGRLLGATAGPMSTTADQQLLRDILQHYDGSR